MYSSIIRSPYSGECMKPMEGSGRVRIGGLLAAASEQGNGACDETRNREKGKALELTQ
jgi:hypothetical protein